MMRGICYENVCPSAGLLSVTLVSTPKRFKISKLIDVLIYSAAQLQECLINLFIYLLTYVYLLNYGVQLNTEGIAIGVLSAHTHSVRVILVR